MRAFGPIECALLRLLDAERANSEGLRKALTALYEACERRANEEGGDFGADIGPAAELAAAAIRSLLNDDGERRDTVSDLLLPCPFCGQKAYIRKRHQPRDPTYQAYCDDCGCGTSDLYRQPALAIQAWNQRALAEIEPAPSDGGGAVSDHDPRARADYGPELSRLRAENERLTGRLEVYKQEVGDFLLGAIVECEARIIALEGERDTAARALSALDRMAWLAAEEDSWFGNENDIAVQRAAAERHRAATGVPGGDKPIL